jgi:uncharacterized membrane protein
VRNVAPPWARCDHSALRQDRGPTSLAASMSNTRHRALDVARGVVMVLMVLDHARDFYNGFGTDPTDLATTTPFLFFTRWVTHYCAPSFVLLAGASAYLYGRKRTAGERARFLLSRGLWLVVLEVTVVRFGWIPEPMYRFTMLQVIWALGISMILLAPISMLPPRALAIFGALMVALHNLLDPVDAHFDNFFWAVLHERELFEPFAGHLVRVAYPIVPWVGVMALGFGLGELYAQDDATRKRWTLRLGLVVTFAFVLVRAINVYGDPAPWSVQRDPMMTVISFLNCEKYPPSFAYLLMTLGPLLLLLAALERFDVPELAVRPFVVFGRVPLFFYVAHIYLLRIPGIVFAVMRFGFPAAVLPPPEGHMGSPEWPLWATYVAWSIALLVLYPICARYGRFKEERGRTSWWVSYV